MAPGMSPDEEKSDYIQRCREWIARRTAQLDQVEKRNADLYPVADASTNLQRLNDLEAGRFWVGVHQWELGQMLETGSIDDYPQKSEND
jgi:hypothetical protein